jgi:hypothetical protein
VIRVFKAFAWMRWRVFVNSLERTSARDTIERFSLAAEKLGPIMAAILLIPSAVLLFVLGLAAGFGLATGGWSVLMSAVRGILFAVLGITLVSPLVLPMRDSSTIVRLLLLPIPRRVLYFAQALGAIGDPWVALVIPLLLGVALGLAVGVHFLAALIALIAGLGFLLFIIGLTTLASSVLQWLLRDRRRGDLVMMLLVLVLPLIGIIPQFLLQPGRVNGRRLTREERQALPPSRSELVIERVIRYVPSELYTRATNTAVVSPPYTLLPLATLGGVALLVHGAAFVAYRRLLDMPTSMGTRRAGAFGGLWDRTIPGLSEGASAVAFTQYRLALRTPRGKASMFTPVIIPLVLAGLAYRRAGAGMFGTKSGGLPFSYFSGGLGLSLAAFGAFAAILTLIPLALNQFAVDKAGFTRQMLSPLSIRDLLTGKAVGNALIALAPALFCFIVPALIFPGGAPALWLSLLLSVVSTYLLFAPAAATWSAIFPKDVDLNSIGNNGNAHQVAGLLGMLSLVASAAPSILLTLFAVAYLQRVNLAPLFVAAWGLFAFGLSQLLFIPVRKLVASRAETIAQYY